MLDITGLFVDFFLQDQPAQVKLLATSKRLLHSAKGEFGHTFLIIFNAAFTSALIRVPLTD